jgi:hypothetical protein
MHPYQQLIDELSMMVNDDRLLDEEQVERLCSQYRKAVNEVNRRLLDCDNLFQRGFKAEVVQEAERSPNLIDTVGMLDFTDLDLLRELVSTFQLDPLPAIRHDIAASINECYSGNQLVDRILRQFRLYSLSLAPLKDRLDLLRKLNMLDDSNVGWAEDVLVFERARISQIQKEIQSATKNRDGRKLQKLNEELKSAEWIEKPPSTIARSIQSTIKQFTDERLAKEATVVFNEFDTAYRERDADHCNLLLPQIEMYLNDHAGSFDPDQASVIVNIQEWLNKLAEAEADEWQYKHLLEQLERELDQGAKIEQIERTFHTIYRLDKPIPDRIVKRVNEAKRTATTKGSRKFSLIVASVVVSLIVVSITAGLIYRSKTRDRRVAEYTTKLNEMITGMRLDEADKFLEELKETDSGLINRPEIVKRQSELAEAQDLETKRLNSFEESKEQVKALLANASTSFAEIKRVQSMIQDAEKQARLPDEKAAMDQFMTQLLTYQRDLQKSVDDKFNARFEPLKKEFESEPDSLVGLRNLLVSLTDLRKESKEVRQEKLVLIEPIVEQLNRLIVAKERMETEKRDLDNLAREFKDTRTFIEALKVYSNLHPESANAGLLKPIIDTEAPVWYQLEEFAGVQQELKAIQKSQLTSKDALRLLGQWKKYKTSVDFHSVFKQEPNVIATLVAYSKRDLGVEGSLTERIQSESLLGHPSIQKAKYLCNLDGRAYYLANAPTQNGAGTVWNYRKYIDPEMNRTVVSTVRANELDVNKSFAPSWSNGLKVVSDPIMNSLVKVKGNSWDDTLGKLILDIQKEIRIDDVLKYRTMRLLIEIAGQGSPILNEVFETHLKVLKQSGVNTDLNWVNPDIKETISARVAVKPVFERLPDIDDTRKRLKQKLENQPKLTSGVIYECVGVARKDDEGGKWETLRSTKRIENDGDIFVLKTGAESGFKRVGTKSGEKIDLIRSSPDLSDFRALWIMIPEAK